VIAHIAGPGNAAAVSVVVSGFPPGKLAYIEECDGVAPSAPQWSPTSHCDLGSSPAAAIVSPDGVASFPASDRNRAFHPFVGESPQSIFNCTGAGVTAPRNDLPGYDNCKIRVSTNNSAVTSDQFFVPLEFVRGTSTPSTTPPRGAAATGRAGASKSGSARSGSGTHPKANAKSNATTNTTSKERAADDGTVARLRGRSADCGAGCTGTSAVSSNAPGLLALGHDDVLSGYLVVLCGIGLACVAVWHRRRASRVDVRHKAVG
jgi:hypothetical protein